MDGKAESPKGQHQSLGNPRQIELFCRQFPSAESRKIHFAHDVRVDFWTVPGTSADAVHVGSCEEEKIEQKKVYV